MTDEAILSGFTSLHEVIADGFARVDAQFARVDAQFIDLRAEMDHRFGALEGRATRPGDEAAQATEPKA